MIGIVWSWSLCFMTYIYAENSLHVNLCESMKFCYEIYVIMLKYHWGAVSPGRRCHSNRTTVAFSDYLEFLIESLLSFFVIWILNTNFLGIKTFVAFLFQMTELSKLIREIKCILYGNSEAEPVPDACMKLTQEFFKENTFRLLVNCLPKLNLEVCHLPSIRMGNMDISVILIIMCSFYLEFQQCQRFSWSDNCSGTHASLILRLFQLVFLIVWR